jgi:hypothetical protein
MSQRLGNAIPADLHTAMETMEARIMDSSLHKAAADRAEAAQAADRVTVSLDELQTMMTGVFRLSLRNSMATDHNYTEISALRQKAETEIAVDVQAVKAACKRAMDEIASHVEVRHTLGNHLSLPANAHQTPLHPSLKRKRSDDEGEVENAGVTVAAGVDAAGKAVESNSNSSAPVAVSSAVQTRRPSAKRMRRMMSTVVHTATAMTVGAVATWGALAFS